MSDKYIRFRTEETAGPVVNDPRGHGHDVLIPRSAFEAVALEVLEEEDEFDRKIVTSPAFQGVVQALSEITAEDWEQFAKQVPLVYANRTRDIPETGAVSAESPDTGDQANAGEDGPVKGASTEPCDIPAESGESEVREALRKFDQAHTPWVVKALTRGWITEEGKEAWNRDVAPHMFRLYAFLPDKAPESEASAGSGDVCPDTTEATFSATRDGAKLTLGASGTFEEEPFCGPGSFEPAAPYGTVDAHLAEQMKDPEFRAEYLRGAARVAAEDGETVLRKLKRDVDAMAKILPSVLELLERAI